MRDDVQSPTFGETLALQVEQGFWECFKRYWRFPVLPRGLEGQPRA